MTMLSTPVTVDNWRAARAPTAPQPTRSTRNALPEIRTGQLAPATVLRRNATGATEANCRRNNAGYAKGYEETPDRIHGGASWNRTSDLHIISVTL